MYAFINMMLEGAQKQWPSLTKEELREAGHTVAGRYRGKRVIIADLSRALDEELRNRHGEPLRSRRS